MSVINRRTVLKQAGAMASLAAGSIALPRAAIASTVPSHVVPENVTSWQYLPNCANTGRDVWASWNVNDTGYDYYLTDHGTEYRVLIDSYATTSDCTVWAVGTTTGALTFKKLWSDGERELAAVNGPWLVTAVGAVILASSSITIQNWAGWKKYKVPVNGGHAVVAKYWVWDAIRSAWMVRTAELISSTGVVNTQATAFHTTFTNTCSLFLNKVDSLITFTTAQLIGTVMLYVALADAAVARLTIGTLAFISVIGIQGYSYYKSATGYAESLWSQMNTASGTVLVAGEAADYS